MKDTRTLEEINLEIERLKEKQKLIEQFETVLSMQQDSYLSFRKSIDLTFDDQK